MEIKKETEKLLFELKAIGMDRRAIERELNYRENYIDQLLSKGGNEKFLQRLKKLYEGYVEKSNTPTKAETIIALQAAVKILTLEVVQLRHLVTKENSTSVSLDIERMMQSEAKRLLS